MKHQCPICLQECDCTAWSQAECQGCLLCANPSKPKKATTPPKLSEPQLSQLRDLMREAVACQVSAYEIGLDAAGLIGGHEETVEAYVRELASCQGSDSNIGIAEVDELLERIRLASDETEGELNYNLPVDE